MAAPSSLFSKKGTLGGKAAAFYCLLQLHLHGGLIELLAPILDATGELHKTRVNGWRLKPYFSQVLEDQAEAAEVSLDSEEPLGKITQDLSLAQHVPCITSMSLGPITRPCIGTDLCNPGTISGHFAIGGEDECTSRLQREDEDTAEGLEREA